MDFESQTAPELTLAENFIDFEENIEQRNLTPEIRAAIGEIVEIGRDTLVSGDPTVSTWERVVEKWKKLVKNTSNQELPDMLGSVLQDFGVELPEKIEN